MKQITEPSGGRVLHPYMRNSNWIPDDHGKFHFRFLFDRNISPEYRARLLSIQREAMNSNQFKDDRIHFEPMKGAIKKSKNEMVPNESN